MKDAEKFNQIVKTKYYMEKEYEDKLKEKIQIQ